MFLGVFGGSKWEASRHSRSQWLCGSIWNP